MGYQTIEGAFQPILSARSRVPGLTEHGISESFPCLSPLSLYGISKRCAELLALEYADAFDFPIWINRCGVLAGRGQFGKADQGIFSFWIRSWKERKPLKYTGFDGKGSQVRDYLHPRDLVPVILRQLAGEKPKDPDDGFDLRICNFGGGLANSCSLHQISHWCRKHLGPHVLGRDPQPRPFDLPWLVMDCRRAEKIWSWGEQADLPTIFDEIAST